MAKVVTITNPVTGQPAQVDQLDHTAQQIDDAVEAARWSHRNLLDNAYWANPDAIIDQRGGYVVLPNSPIYKNADTSLDPYTTDKYIKVDAYNDNNWCAVTIDGDTTYRVWSVYCVRGYTGAGYGIDRWKISNGSSGTCWMLIEDDGITIGTDTKYGVYFIQTIDPSVVKALAGKTVTLSVLAGGKSGAFVGTIYINGSWNDYWAIKANDVSTKKYTIPANATSMRIQYAEGGSGAATCKLKAAKLELGTVQTIAHQDEDGNWVLNDPPPDKGMELAKCQRYCFVWDYGNVNTSCLAVFQAFSSTNAFGIIPTPVTLRATPTVSGGDLVSGGKKVVLSVMVKCANGIRAIAIVDGGSLAAGQAVAIENGDGNNRVVFSADL